jgi:ankyrin repeat protein
MLQVAPSELISCTDAEHLYSIFEAAKWYFCPSRDHVNLDDFKGIILITAVKNKCQDAIMQLLENPTSKASSSDNSCFESALAVASTLASQFIKQELNDELHKNSERDNSQISLLSWAVQCRHIAVVQVLIEKSADVDAKDNSDGRWMLRAAGPAWSKIPQFRIDTGNRRN